MIRAGSQGMFSAKGRMTIHLFPQFQGERKPESKRPEVSYTQGREKRTRREKKKKDEFFFYNILDYNKEAEAKLRDTSYIRQSDAPPIGKYKPRYKAVWGDTKGTVRYTLPNPKPTRKLADDARTERTQASPQERDSLMNQTSLSSLGFRATRTIDFKKMIPRMPPSLAASAKKLPGLERQDRESSDPQREQAPRPGPRHPGGFRGVQFQRQTARKPAFPAANSQTAGIEYNTAFRSIGSNTRGTLSFLKTLPREKSALKASPSPKRSVLHFKKNSFEVKNCSLLDFKHMTGRDKAPLLRDGYSPLQAVPPPPPETKTYQRRDGYHLMDVEEIMAHNLRMIGADFDPQHEPDAGLEEPAP